jgi:hypothetical protein
MVAQKRYTLRLKHIACLAFEPLRPAISTRCCDMQNLSTLQTRCVCVHVLIMVPTVSTDYSPQKYLPGDFLVKKNCLLRGTN